MRVVGYGWSEVQKVKAALFIGFFYLIAIINFIWIPKLFFYSLSAPIICFLLGFLYFIKLQWMRRNLNNGRFIIWY